MNFSGDQQRPSPSRLIRWADDGALRHVFEPEWLEGDTLSGEHILRMLALLHRSRHAVFSRHCRARKGLAE